MNLNVRGTGQRHRSDSLDARRWRWRRIFVVHLRRRRLAFQSVVFGRGRGVIGLARSLAKRYGADNIRFNVVCPGTTDTPMLDVLVSRPDEDDTKGKDLDELKRIRSSGNPMGRAARPEEVANAALFLLSSEASYVNGASLLVDGGKTA